MSASELKGSLHHMIDTIEDTFLLERLLAYFQSIQKNSPEDWAIADEQLTEMSLQLSAHSLAEVWNNEADEHWNEY